MSTSQLTSSLDRNEQVLHPTRATLQWLNFATAGEAPQPAATSLQGSAISTVLVAAAEEISAGFADEPPADLAVLAVSAPPDHTGMLPADAMAWVERGGPAQLLAMHGAVIAWRPGRTAIWVTPERLLAVQETVVEFCFYERELRSIEAEVALGWPQVEKHAHLAFEFRDRDSGREHELGQRFQFTLALRARLSRLAPQLERPQLFPQNLANQIAERLRERSRMAERASFLDGQLAVQERVYDLCGERSSDWKISRRSLALEWMIVVLLVVQTVLLLVELLTRFGG